MTRMDSNLRLIGGVWFCGDEPLPDSTAPGAFRVAPAKPRKQKPWGLRRPEPDALVDLDVLPKHPKPNDPRICGVYFLFKDGALVYVGKSVNIAGRLRSHAAEKDFDTWAWVPCDRLRLDQTERAYIDAHLPPLNNDPTTKRRRLTAGKRAP